MGSEILLEGLSFIAYMRLKKIILATLGKIPTPSLVYSHFKFMYLGIKKYQHWESWKDKEGPIER